MVHAILYCSDDECPVVVEATGPLEEIETLACDCGCAFAVVAWPAPLPETLGAAPLAVDVCF